MNTAEEIIQEALTCRSHPEPVTFLEHIFSKHPSRNQLNSIAILHLTERVMSEIAKKENALMYADNCRRASMKIIQQYGPKAEQMLISELNKVKLTI
jgi:hypothetical protein